MNKNLEKVLKSSPVRYKWNFKNKPTNKLNETRAFRTKSGWEPPKRHTFLQVFWSLVEKELFSDKMNNSTQSNLSGEKWKTLRNLADDGSILIKGADKSSSVVVSSRDDYLQEVFRQVRDTNAHGAVKLNKNIFSKLVERSNTLFNRLCSLELISEKELN